VVSEASRVSPTQGQAPVRRRRRVGSFNWRSAARRSPGRAHVEDAQFISQGTAGRLAGSSPGRSTPWAAPEAPSPMKHEAGLHILAMVVDSFRSTCSTVTGRRPI